MDILVLLSAAMIKLAQSQKYSEITSNFLGEFVASYLFIEWN
jgi:hypothetical protein